jgi:hypothetical protein
MQGHCKQSAQHEQRPEDEKVWLGLSIGKGLGIGLGRPAGATG